MKTEMPKSIVRAEAIDLNTSKKHVLTTTRDSYCHFFQRFPVGSKEVGLRLDWKDIDSNGDPKLDADVFNPGESKPIKDFKKFPSHQTPKKKDASTGLYIYEFEFEGTKLSLQIQLTRVQEISGTACIEAAKDN
jgi:hypothetical protein